MTQVNANRDSNKSFMTKTEALEKIAKILIDLGNSLQEIGIAIKEAACDLVESELGLTEEVFTVLKWEEKEGERLGKFEIASRDANKDRLDAWEHAFRILKANNATLREHFGSKSWGHYYWLYNECPDVIFRKRREAANGN